MKRLKLVVFLTFLFITAIKSLATNSDKLESRYGIIFIEKHLIINDTIINKDLVNQDKPYEVIRSSPGLNFSIRRLGNGNKILFSRKNGLRYLPKMNIYQDSGFEIQEEKKKGFDNVSFPFTCKISTEIGFRDKIYSEINGFEIIIYEDGIWEISFN